MIDHVHKRRVATTFSTRRLSSPLAIGRAYGETDPWRAMSQENVELARAIHRSWAKGDFSSVVWAHPDIEFVLSGPDSQVHRGLRGMGRAWGEWLQAWDEFRVEPREFIDVDDAVLVLIEFRGRKATGVSVESMTGANVFWFRDGKVVRLVVHTDRPKRLEAVGLQELAMLLENVEVVRRAFEIVQEGVRRGDPGAAFDKSVREGIVASNLEWRAGARGGVGVAGAEDAVGRDGFVQFMHIWTEDSTNLRCSSRRSSTSTTIASLQSQ